MPYVLAPTAGYFKFQQFGSVDLNNPRAQSKGLTGIGARADAAQANQWEAIAVFSAAVFVNHLRGDADAGTSALLAQGFIAARFGHVAMYLADFAPLRSVAFLAGLGCSIGLFFV